MIFMRKALFAVIGLFVVAAVAWSGFWFYGKGRIADEVEAQAQLIRDRGGDVAYDDIEIGGFPFGYTGRIVAPTATMTQETTIAEGVDPVETSYTWSAPWIEASATVTAPNTLELTFPETQNVLLTISGQDDETVTMPIEMTSENLEITTTRDGTDVRFEGGAQKIRTVATMDTGDAGNANVDYTMRALKTSGVFKPEQSTDKRLHLMVDYDIEGFDGTTTIDGNDEMPGGTLAFKGGAAVGKVDTLGAETVGSFTLADLAATLDFPAMGDQPVEIGLGTMSMNSQTPNSAGPDAQPFAYRMELESVTLGDQIWAMLDPAKAFPRAINALAVDLSGDAVFIALPSDTEAFVTAMEDGMPIIVNTMKLNDLTVDALGLKAKGKGEGTLENNIPQGTATLGVGGFADFMNSLVKSGRIPPQQAMVVQLMVENFGKLDEDGETIRFDFAAREGMIYVNDVPIGEAPMLPQ